MLSENGMYIIKNGLKQLKIEVLEKQIELINKFYEIYSEWNKKINLSSIDNEEDFIKKHVLDSATGIPFIDHKKVADLGSGGGLPGVIIKILKPELEISLIESVSKKVNYLKELIKSLNLDINVYNPTTDKIPNDFNIIITRAFGPLLKIYKTGKLYTKNKIIAYKGKYEKILEEIKELKGIIKKDNIDIKKVEVPFTEFERHIVIMSLK